VIFLAMALFFLWRCPPLTVPFGGPASPQGEEKRSDFLAGFRFVYSQKTLFGAISLDLVGVLFGGVVALLPIFATQLGVGAIGLGWLHAAPSIGALLLALYYTRHPLHDNMGPFFLGSVFLFGVTIILFAVSQNVYWSAFLLALGGAADNVSVIVRATLMRTLVPDSLRGRVAAVNGIFIGSSNELGAFESGLAAQLLGVIPSVIVGGTITCLSVLCAYFLFPELKEMSHRHKKF
jgi:MFS family permease